jgi:transposase InsO family protein
LWITDITEHPTAEGKLYCAAVMDAYSRLIVGWSIAGHMRTELVTDALGMAIIRRPRRLTTSRRVAVAPKPRRAAPVGWSW